MTVVKLFTFSELPNYASNYTFKMTMDMMGDSALDYGAFEFRIGSLCKEYDDAVKSEGQKSADKNYGIQEVNLDRKVAEWFYKKGCTKGEKVFLAR